MFINIKLKKKTYTFLKVLPTFPRAPTNFATYLPSEKKCLAWSEKRTLTTLTQETLIYLSADKFKGDDWCFTYILFPLALESKKQNTTKSWWKCHASCPRSKLQVYQQGNPSFYFHSPGSKRKYHALKRHWLSQNIFPICSSFVLVIASDMHLESKSEKRMKNVDFHTAKNIQIQPTLFRYF